jgi:transposase
MLDPNSLVFLDETSVKTDITRIRGWSAVGQRLMEAIPSGRWATCTLVHAIALDGTRAAMVLDGPLNGPSFSGFCEWLLAPSLKPGDFVIMDNLNTHKSAQAVKAIESVGASAVYLPPYSPDLNPIENVFSKLKQLIRAFRPRQLKQIVDAVAQSIKKITLDDILAVFQHAGYYEYEKK